MSTTQMVSRTHCCLKDTALEMSSGAGPMGRENTPRTGEKVRSLCLHKSSEWVPQWSHPLQDFLQHPPALEEDWDHADLSSACSSRDVLLYALNRNSPTVNWLVWFHIASSIAAETLTKARLFPKPALLPREDIVLRHAHFSWWFFRMCLRATVHDTPGARWLLRFQRCPSHGQKCACFWELPGATICVSWNFQSFTLFFIWFWESKFLKSRKIHFSTVDYFSIQNLAIWVHFFPDWHNTCNMI